MYLFDEGIKSTATGVCGRLRCSGKGAPEECVGRTSYDLGLAVSSVRQ
jgi:hypothetical protein